MLSLLTAYHSFNDSMNFRNDFKDLIRGLDNKNFHSQINNKLQNTYLFMVCIYVSEAVTLNMGNYNICER